MIRERATIEIVVFRDDGDGAQCLDAVWNNLEDALYHIRGVERVVVKEREVMETTALVDDKGSSKREGS